MKKLFGFLIIAVFVASCSTDKATVKLIVPNAPDSTEVVVNCLAINQIVPVDTIYVKSGAASFSTKCVEGSPDFYYFISGGKKIASVVARQGDKIVVTTDGNGNISEISGSPESVLFNEVEKQMGDSYSQFESLSLKALEAEEKGDEKLRKEIMSDLAKVYMQQKKNSIKHIYTNSKSITVIPVLYQKFSPELPVFGADTDVYLLKMAYDSLKTAYPHSPYILSLADDIAAKESYLNLKNKVDNAVEASYPNLSLLDQNAQVRTLSDLDGNVIILSFWTISQPAQRVFNAELKNVYDKYHKKGVEIYQVSIDTDKTAWASVIKEQGLNWISVCDPGNAAQSLNVYNLTQLPALFVFDKKGDLVARDLFNEGELDKAVAKLVR